MSRREDLGRICIESPVVDIQEKGDRAGEPNVLSFGSNLCVGKEERHLD